VRVLDFKQGLFALSPRPGVRLSEASIRSAVKLSGFTFSRMVSPADGPSNERPMQATPPDAVDRLLITARRTFRGGDRDRAAKMAVEIVSKLSLTSERDEPVDENGSTDGSSPRDADALQFVALMQFSQREYTDAVKYARMALLRGAPWDWNTLSSHYVKPEDYSAQLRKLELSIRAEPQPEKRFLIGYHYWMMGHHEAAHSQFEKAAAGMPDDQLIPKLIERLDESRSKSGRSESGR
jgi:tetratricopeptide (TPR) repeat protein